MGKLGNALILSPFATHPLDAGQRKRAYQTTALLQERGFSITFLHFAFETRWYWGHNSEDDAVLKEQWDGDVHHFYANKNVGQLPVNGESHQLDEWWDEDLGGYIRNIFSMRKFDLFVVHNIWLSKAFDYAPSHCLKVLEMHDLFNLRAKEFEATGVAPQFFYCSEQDELFGLRRADLLFAIKQEDVDWCMAREIGKTKVMSIPYVEANSLRPPITNSDARTKPLHPGKVIFGMIGSDIHFNRHAIHKLIKELDAVIQQTYAPIEFVLAGSICNSVGECPHFVRKLGFVDGVEDFYSCVDVVMVPMLHGTGVKIKSVEALYYGKPVLFTSHSAKGTGFQGRVCHTLAEMAQWAAEIALGGTVPLDLRNECDASLDRTRNWIEEAMIHFLAFYNQKRPSFIQFIGTSSAPLLRVLFETFAGLSLYKELSESFRPQGVCIQPVMNQYVTWVPSLPLGEIQTMTEAIEAWSSATLAVVSFSQRKILKVFSYYDGPRLILFDCRFATVEALCSDDIRDYGHGQNIACLLTPMQICMLDTAFDMPHIAFPFLSERSTWDPHLTSLYLKVMQNLAHGCVGSLFQICCEAEALDPSNISIGNDNGYPYDLTMARNEAISEILYLVNKLE